jgi:hypothetical protein
MHQKKLIENAKESAKELQKSTDQYRKVKVLIEESIKEEQK